MARPPARADSGPPVLFLGGLLLAGVGASAQATADGVADCRRIAEATARLACYDALPGPPSTAQPGASPLPTPVELFGRDATATAAELRTATGVTSLDSLEVALTAVTRLPDGKLRLTLANGQQWTQTDTRRARATVGATVTIRRAALGSFLLSTGDGGAPIRVRRTK